VQQQLRSDCMQPLAVNLTLHCDVAASFFPQNATLPFGTLSCMYPASLAVAHFDVYCPAVLRNLLTCAACLAVAPVQLMATVSFHDVPAARRCLQPLLPLLETAMSRIKDSAVCFGLRVRCLPMPPLKRGPQPGCSVQPFMMHPRACLAAVWLHVGPWAWLLVSEVS
jgi:hypothetical protein